MARPHPAELQIAALAHQLWCDRLIAEGWTPGKRFDASARTHDALVPFEELSQEDRRSVALDVMSLELLDTLSRLPSYEREAEPELKVAQLFAGMRVTFLNEPGSRGTVISWKEDRDWPGFVEIITVRWDSGEAHEYAAAERELRPIE